jgi:hypothetical protein
MSVFQSKDSDPVGRSLKLRVLRRAALADKRNQSVAFYVQAVLQLRNVDLVHPMPENSPHVGVYSRYFRNMSRLERVARGS